MTPRQAIVVRVHKPNTSEERERAREIRSKSSKVPTEFRYEMIGDDGTTLLCSDLAGKFSGSNTSYLVFSDGMNLREGFLKTQTTVQAKISNRVDNLRSAAIRACGTADVKMLACSDGGRSSHWIDAAIAGDERHYVVYEDVPEIIRLDVPASAREKMHAENVLEARLEDIRDGDRYKVVAWEERSRTFYALRPLKDSTKIAKPGAWAYGFLGADHGRIREFMGKPELGQSPDEKQRIRDLQNEIRAFGMTSLRRQQDGSPPPPHALVTYDKYSTAGVLKARFHDDEFGYVAVVPSRHRDAK